MGRFSLCSKRRPQGSATFPMATRRYRRTIQATLRKATTLMFAFFFLTASWAFARGFPDSSHMCIFVGQSNTEGYKALPLVDGEPSSPGGGTMFAIGPRIFPDGGGDDTPLDVSTLGSIVPVHEMYAPG